MKAVILAAGISRRLRPITDSMPKCIIKIGGITLIERNIDSLIEAGISTITVVVGYLKECIIKELEKISEAKGMDIYAVENPNYASTGSGYSLYCGIRSLPTEDDIVFMDADILIHPDIIKGIKDVAYRSFLYVGAKPCDDEAVKVKVDERGRVVRLTKEIDNTEGILGESIGIVKLGRTHREEIISIIKKNIKNGNRGFEWEELFDNNRTVLINAVTSALPWTEIDFESDLKRAEAVALAIEGNEKRLL